ncbi:MAG: ATPase [Pseudomonadota bacterium]
MLYQTPDAYLQAPRKSVALVGMSGVGKTRLAAMLRAAGAWFHYSVDYRIGTRYMGEHIVDNFKREAMRNPFLRSLLLSDSIYISSNLTFENLAPLSTYLGKPGDAAKGGLDFEDYVARQAQHRDAETQALLDTGQFIEKAREIYGYPHFLCDTGGSICEVVDPWDTGDPVLSALSARCLIVEIRGTEAMADDLAARFAADPKPMYYQEAFLREIWDAYRANHGEKPSAVDPDAFAIWGFRRLIAHREPRYRAIGTRWGVTVAAESIEAVRGPADFDRLLAEALAARTGAETRQHG